MTFDGLQTVKIRGIPTRQPHPAQWIGGPCVNASGRGDLFVHLDVHIPSRLSHDQRKLFKQLREELPAKNEPREKGLLDKVRDYFL